MGTVWREFHVPHDVVDVLAELGSVGSGLASAEAELGVGHEALRTE